MLSHDLDCSVILTSSVEDVLDDPSRRGGPLRQVLNSHPTQCDICLTDGQLQKVEDQWAWSSLDLFSSFFVANIFLSYMTTLNALT